MTSINRNLLEVLDNGSDILKELVMTLYQTGDKNIYESLFISKATMIGTTAGAFGLASLIGTASTGTAIGTLSGAAATNATLAWVGGSMLAGTALLTGGGIVAAFAAVKFYNGSPKPLEELTLSEKEIISTCLNLVKAIEELETGKWK